MIVHVNTQGARIVREGRHLLVKKENDTNHTLFTHKLEQLILLGNVIVTPQAMKLLMRESIDTVFLRFDGRYVGRLAQGEQKNVFLRKRQFLLTDDLIFCRAVASQILTGKLLNMTTVIQRIQRTRGIKIASDPAGEIRRLVARLPQSIFEVDVDSMQFARMKHRAEMAMDYDEDGVKYFPLCDRCSDTLISIGKSVKGYEDADFLVL